MQGKVKGKGKKETCHYVDKMVIWKIGVLRDWRGRGHRGDGGGGDQRCQRGSGREKREFKSWVVLPGTVLTNKGTAR